MVVWAYRRWHVPEHMRGVAPEEPSKWMPRLPQGPRDRPAEVKAASAALVLGPYDRYGARPNERVGLLGSDVVSQVRVIRAPRGRY